MLTAIIELPHTAISRYDWLVYIINVVLTHNRNRTLANLCEVINHPLHRNTLADGYFCVAMLYLDDYVFFVVVLNQAVYVCWVYAPIKAKTFEVDKLFHPLWILNFAFHNSYSSNSNEFGASTRAIIVIRDDNQCNKKQDDQKHICNWHMSPQFLMAFSSLRLA